MCVFDYRHNHMAPHGSTLDPWTAYGNSRLMKECCAGSIAGRLSR
jgi:hypothetical protein